MLTKTVVHLVVLCLWEVYSLASIPAYLKFYSGFGPGEGTLLELVQLLFNKSSELSKRSSALAIIFSFRKPTRTHTSLTYLLE
jgi:hypothetical protein